MDRYLTLLTPVIHTLQKDVEEQPLYSLQLWTWPYSQVQVKDSPDVQVEDSPEKTEHESQHSCDDLSHMKSY